MEDAHTEQLEFTIYNQFASSEKCHPPLGVCDSVAAYGVVVKDPTGQQVQPSSVLCKTHALQEFRRVKATNEKAKQQMQDVIEKIEQGRW